MVVTKEVTKLGWSEKIWKRIHEAVHDEEGGFLRLRGVAARHGLLGGRCRQHQNRQDTQQREQGEDPDGSTGLQGQRFRFHILLHSMTLYVHLRRRRPAGVSPNTRLVLRRKDGARGRAKSDRSRLDVHPVPIKGRIARPAPATSGAPAPCYL